MIKHYLIKQAIIKFAHVQHTNVQSKSLCNSADDPIARLFEAGKCLIGSSPNKKTACNHLSSIEKFNCNKEARRTKYYTLPYSRMAEKNYEFSENKMPVNKRIKRGVVASFIITWSGIVLAQEQDQPNFEELIVTAQKREQNVQEVPIAINVYRGDTLEDSGVESTLELRFVEPSLVFTTNAASGQPYLRGVGSDLITPGAESSIAIFLNDVYQSRTASSVQDLFDVERVDVVKGPQGVLFGRNAVGGAINIYTKKPGDEFGGTIKGTVGNFGKARFEGALDIPLTENVQLRVAGLTTQRDGFSSNIFTGGDVNDENLEALRAHIQMDLTDNFDVLVSVHHSEEDSTRNLDARVNTEGGFAIADAFGAIRSGDVFETALDEDSNLEFDSSELSVDANWKFDNFSLRSITSIRQLDLDITLDLDASQLAFASNSPVQESETFTQEFQLVSNTGGKLEWILGAFFLSEDASQQLNISLNFPAITGAPNGILDQPGGTVETTSFGIFGNVRYGFSDQWAISAGLRYNEDDRELDFFETISAGGNVVAEIPLQLEEDFDDVTPRVVLEYTPNADTLIYASFSEGYKAGGFNTNVFQTEGFDSENLNAFELGAKTTFSNRRGRLNAAIYNYDYSDLQLNVIPANSSVGTFQSVINAAEATIQGFEADILFAATSSLEFTAGLALVDAEFSEFLTVNPNDQAAGTISLSGGELPRAPSSSFTLGTNYTWNFGADALVWNINYRYEADQFLDPFQDDIVSRDNNSIFNSRLTYNLGDNFSVALWARNLTDEEVVQSALRVDGLFGTIEFHAPPRTYGLTVEYTFF